MKLHSIEAVNLNSLYGPHPVDLDDTLSGASLFLIHGPTGSGKSTLMDAVSLALFGTTPRLTAQRGDDTADPRAIMSRGASECSATIVFSKLEGGARVTYRAQWTCHRAYRRADGALQKPARGLDRRERDGSWTPLVSSHKDQDYKPHFAAVLEGFGVADFNRSMLLAQGQFDAFLGAPPDQRAEILERLTDTSDYQRIGARAARLRGRYMRQIEALRTLAAAGGGLDAGALTELKQRHALHEEQLADRKRAWQTAQTHLQWHDTSQTLQRHISAAHKDREQLALSLADAAADLAALAEHERCEQHHASKLLAEREACVRLITSLDGQIKELDAQTPALEAAVVILRADAGQAAHASRHAAQHLDLMRPLVHAAETAAQTRSDVVARQALATTERDQAKRQLKTHQDEREQAELSLKASQAAARAAAHELQAHADTALQPDAWAPIRTRLDRLIAAAEALDRQRLDLTLRAKDLTDARSELAGARTEQSTASERLLEPLTTAHEAAVSHLAGLTGELQPDERRAILLAERDEARVDQDRLRDLSPLLASAADAARVVTELDSRRRALTPRLTEADQRLQSRTTAAQQQRELLGQSTLALDRLRRACALVEHRADLVDDEACPLCGATEHPWVDDASLTDRDAELTRLVADAERSADDTRKASEQADSDLREAEGRLRELTASSTLLTEQHEAAALRLDEASQTSRLALTEADLPADCDVQAIAARIDAAAQLGSKAETELEELGTAERKLTAAATSLQRAQQRQQALVAGLRERASALEARNQTLTDDREQLVVATAEHEAEHDACVALLADHGLTSAETGPADWRATGDHRVQAHQARVQAATSSAARVGEAEAREAGVAALVKEVDERLTRLQDQLDKLDIALIGSKEDLARHQQRLTVQIEAAWTSQMASGAGPVPALEVPPARALERWKTWSVAAQDQQTHADSALREAEDAFQATGIRRRTLGEELQARERDREQARSDLDAALAVLAIADVRTLEERLLAPDEVERIGAARRDLDARSAAIEARVRERQAHLETHEEARPADLPEPADRELLAATLSRVEEDLAAATTAHQETVDQLRDHQRALDEQEEGRRKLREAERASRIWMKLHEFIGVNDGGRFKEFAQALNLGKLLDKANRHLSRLAPRYRLVSRLKDELPTLEFDLADLWQVGQRVAPRSLSGGERFLVSLSLALGLSDFRALRMPIETLLLDEGFGTLDADALGVALAALGQLRAGGRQVGIISHVAGLPERIEARIEVVPLGGGRSRVRTHDDD